MGALRRRRGRRDADRGRVLLHAPAGDLVRRRATRSRPSSSARRCRASGAGGPCGCAPTARRRSPSTAGTTDERRTCPFALNVLTFRGELDQRRHRLHHPHAARGRRPRGHRAHARAAHRPAQAAGGVRELRRSRAPELTLEPASARGAPPRSRRSATSSTGPKPPASPQRHAGDVSQETGMPVKTASQRAELIGGR